MKNQITFDLNKVQAKQYWLERLADFREIASFAGEFSRDAASEKQLEELDFVVDGQTFDEIKRITKGSPLLAYTTLLAALNICLAKYSGKSSTIIGSPVLKLEVEDSSAPNHLLAIKTEVNPRNTFKALLAEIHSRLKEDYRHQNYTYEDLTKDSDFNKTERFADLFDCCFGLENIHSPFPDTNCSLKIWAKLEEERITGKIAYENSKLSGEAVEGIKKHFLNLLKQALENPEIEISRMQLPDENEKSLLLAEFNSTAKNYQEAILFPQIFEEQAAKNPDRAAVGFAGFALSYGEINEKANQLANYLKSSGICAETCVGIALERSIEMVVAVLAVLKSGAAFVPLDLQTPPERLGYLLNDSNAQILLSKQAYLPLLADFTDNILCLDTQQELFENQSAENLAVSIEPEQIAYIIYTSGSTGYPKGVAIEHRGLLNYLNWCLDKYSLADGSLFHTPLSFDLTITSLLPPLMIGKTVEIIPESPGVEALTQALTSTEKYGLLKITPSHLQLLTDSFKDKPEIGGLGCMVIGGEALKTETMRFWKSEYPQIRYFNEYGPTETVVGCCVYEVQNDLAQIVPIGKPISNQQLYVLDEFYNPLPIGVAGELYIAGKGIARGYWNKFDLTAEKFIPNPFGDKGTRLYQTGDLARFNSNGDLEYLGRTDNQVKIRGFRIELNEIEFNLCLFPNVKNIAVAVKEDQHGEQKIVAYFVMEDDAATPDIKEVRQFLRQSLPDYMLPSAVVKLDEIPLTTNGKTDLKNLPSPDWTNVSADSKTAANLTEELLLGIWREILGVSDITVDDNFFELGGHSLLATRVATQIRDVWKVDLELGVLFENPTISKIGQWLENQHRTGNEQPLLEAQTETAGETPTPLSHAQYRLWFLEQLNPGSPLYNVQLAIRLRGNLDVEALQKSLDAIVARHEILRTAFVKEGNEPVQIVLESKPLDFPVEDLTNIDEDKLEAETRTILQREVLKGFDLTEGNLIRGVLAKINEDEYVAVLTMHHIVFDGWSTAIFVREVGELYKAFSTNGSKSNLPELKVQYGDYARWQRNWLQGAELEKQLAYWRQQLAGIPDYIGLPTDKPRPQIQSQRGDVVSTQFDKELVRKLKRVSQTEAVTLFMTLMAGFRALLYRYSGQNDIVIGTPIAGRNNKQTEELIGIFINTLVLRGNVTGKSEFSNLIRQERDVCLGAYSHQDIPFEKIVEELNPERNLGHAPIFQVMLTLQNMNIGVLELGDLSMSNVEIPSAGARYDLAVWLVEVGEKITCSIEYNADLFERETVERFLNNYKKLLSVVSENTEISVADIKLVDEIEQQKVLTDWNNNDKSYDREHFTADLIVRIARETPNKTAIKFNDETLSYGELEILSGRVAANLKRKGVGAEDRIGICLNRSPNVFVSILGILKSGTAYVPLDADYPADRIGFMAHDSQVKLIISQEEHRGLLKDLPCEKIIIEEILEKPASAETENVDERRIDGENLAYMIYTSGSTGKPKGTMVSHTNLLHSTMARTLYYEDKPEVYLLLSSFSFDSSVAGIFWTLCSGGTLLLPPQGFEKDPSMIKNLIRENKVSILLCLPSLYGYILQNSANEELKSLRTVIVAGEKCSPEIVENHYKALPRVKLFNEYGPTEATVWSTVGELKAEDGRRNISIGKPIPNSKIYVLDERNEIVPIGIPGEIFIGGQGVTRGYLNQTGNTADKFIPDAFTGISGGRLYGTGDIGRYRSDGEIEFWGRHDEQLKIRGYRIEVGEIEAVLNEYEDVAASMVVGQRDSLNSRRLVAYYVAKTPDSQLSGKLKAHLERRLPEYMIPKIFMRLDQIPLSPNGKVNRGGLPLPNFDRDNLTNSYVAPANSTEKQIAGIWSKILKVEKVGRTDNFFELGGHSFLIIKVHEEITRELKKEFPLLKLFEFPSVAAISQYLETEKAAAQEVSYDDWADNRRKALSRRKV